MSYEPALGMVDFTLRGHQIDDWDEDWKYDTLRGKEFSSPRDDSEPTSPALDLIIVGGESGNGARPCDVNNVRFAVRQCEEADVSCFVKQLGSVAVDNDPMSRCSWPGGTHFKTDDQTCRVLLNHSKGGDPNEWPQDLRVQQLPSK